MHSLAPARHWRSGSVFADGPLPLLALLALVAAAFANALGAGFVLDDAIDIADNPSARIATFLDRLPYTNRPLTKASYALNDAVHGLVPAGYAAINVALHLVSAALAFFLVRRIFQSSRDGAAGLCALAVCAVWAVHPALTESVTYLSGRSMALSAMLMLAALYVSTGPRPRPALAFAFALLAPLARETALILPLVLLWWAWTIGLPRGRLWPVWGGAALAALLLALMPRHRDLVAFSLEMRDPLTALRGNLHAATETLSFWFQPWRVTILPETPPPYGWLETPTLIRLAGFAAAIALAVALRRRAPVLAFAIGLTLIALAPSQSLLWRADPVALKPLYLAGLGLSLALVDGLRRIFGPHVTLVAALAIALPLGVATHQRNALFVDEATLFADAVAATPRNGRAWLAYGSALMGQGRYDEAETALRTAARFLADDERAMNLLELIATIRSMERRRGAP